MSFAIVTGNGFTTNAQRVNNDGQWTGHTVYGVGAIFNSGYSFLLNYKYDLTFKHRSSSGITWFATPTPWNNNGSPEPENIYNAFYFDAVTSNEGTASITGGTLWITPNIVDDYYNNHWFVRTTPKHLGFACYEATSGYIDYSWIEIDEVNLYHNYCPSYPMCSTLEVSNFSTTGMTLTGVVNPYGLPTTAQFKVTSPTTNYYTCDENPIFSAKGMENIYVSKTIPYVTGSTIYYTMNAYNSAGSFTGNTVNLIAPRDPVIKIENGNSNSYPTNHTYTGITLNALIDLYWLPTDVVIEWGTSLSYGETTPVLGMITSGISIDLHIYASLTGLSSSSLYYYRFKATTALGTVYHSGHTFRTINLMDTFQGGKVIYFSDNGHGNGIVITENDVSTGATWGCSGDTISTNTGYFAGSGNTIAITNTCSGATNATIAAKLCLDLSWSGYTDWWLPTLIELQEICPYKTALGMDGLSYWSSQQSTPTTNAVYLPVNVFCPISSGSAPKSTTERVRAVRYF